MAVPDADEIHSSKRYAEKQKEFHEVFWMSIEFWWW
jgi:hypothetical protein